MSSAIENKIKKLLTPVDLKTIIKDKHLKTIKKIQNKYRNNLKKDEVILELLDLKEKEFKYGEVFDTNVMGFFINNPFAKSEAYAEFILRELLLQSNVFLIDEPTLAVRLGVNFFNLKDKEKKDWQRIKFLFLPAKYTGIFSESMPYSFYWVSEVHEIFEKLSDKKLMVELNPFEKMEIFRKVLNVPHIRAIPVKGQDYCPWYYCKITKKPIDPFIENCIKIVPSKTLYKCSWNVFSWQEPDYVLLDSLRTVKDVNLLKRLIHWEELNLLKKNLKRRTEQ